ncbi:hypothetical protein ABIB25_000031 [Nakamurella sp. UYEF19]
MAPGHSQDSPPHVRAIWRPIREGSDAGATVPIKAEPKAGGLIEVAVGQRVSTDTAESAATMHQPSAGQVA